MNIYLKSFVITVLAMLVFGALSWGFVMYPLITGGILGFIILYLWTLFCINYMD